MKKNLIYCLFIIVVFLVNGCNMETPQQKAQKEVDRVILETKREVERQKAVDIPVDSRPPIPVILGHLVRDFMRRYH